MAAGSTYTPIATTTLGSNQTSYTFSSIPSTYTDLRLVCAMTSSAGQNTWIQLNSDTGSNYSSTYVQGSGTAASSGRTSNSAQGYIDYAGTTGQHTVTVDLMNYSNSTTYKTWITRGMDSATGTIAYVSMWRSTSAVNSITIVNGAASGLLTGSQFTLYGIAAA